MANDKNFKVKNGIDSGGVITSPGGNSSNWNIAFSWGDHAGLYSLLGHVHPYLPLAGGTLTGDLLINKINPVIKLYEPDDSTGTFPAIEFETSNLQGVRLYHTEFDSQLPIAGYGLVLDSTSTNSQYPTTGTLSLVVKGEIFTGSTSLGSTQKVWHEGSLTTINKANYDTAYSWGDHAAAGYASGSFLPLAGGALTGSVTSDSPISTTYNVSDGTVTMYGFGLTMSRGDSYIRPTVTNTQTLHIGAADTSLNWIHVDTKVSNTFRVNSIDVINNVGEIVSAVALPDNAKATFGDSDDLQIYHNGNNSFIADVGTGNLYLRAANNIFIEGATANESMATFQENGFVKLYFNSGEKLATTATGIDVTGRVVATENTDAIRLRSFTNGVGVNINFSDHVGGSYAQNGSIRYVHSDTSSYGSGNAFIVESTEPDMTFLADGKLMYKEGLYLKPATGTGAGTRKDLNWDTAYSWGDHAGNYLPLAGGTLTGALNFGDGVYAQFGDSQDLKIGHSADTSYIQDVGTGNLFISTNGVSINLRGGNNNNDMAVFTSNGGVQLNHAGAARFSVGLNANTSNVNLDVNGVVTATGGTLTGDLTISSSGLANSANITLTNNASSTFNHSLEAFAPNLTAGEHNILVFGKAGNTKNSGYIGYNWAGDASNSNYVTIGHWGNDDIFRVYADSSVKVGSNTIWHAGNDGSGSGLDADLLDGIDSSGFVKARGWTNWNDSTVLNNVIGMLGWKNYGNSHVIFDASASLSPNGVAVNANDAANAWTSSYPTLMGWNGASTYGVRVDSARVANTASNADLLDGIDSGSFLRSDADDAFTGNLTTGANNHITFGPNSTWGSSLRVGGDGRTATGTEMASMVTTDGNLHLDAANSANGIYLNFYAGTNGTYFGNGASGVVAKMFADGQLYKSGTTVNPYWNSTNDGSGSGLDADLLDGKQKESFNPVAARYITTSGASGRLRITLPFLANSLKMLSFKISGYGQYDQWEYQVSGYLYPTSNNWYLPKVVFTGTSNPDIQMGRDANGYAYVSIPRYSYMGVTVHSITLGYVSSEANAYEGWSITDDATTAPNQVTPTVSTAWHSTNDGSGSGLDADLLDGQQPSALSVNYANTAGSAPANGGTATALNGSNYISRRGGTGNYNTDFTNVPAGAMNHQGDDAYSTNSPGGTWWFLDNYRHSNSTNYWGTQVAWGWEDNANRLRQRNVSGGNYSGWVSYWNDNNDGSGSGLDADLLDGIDSTSFVRSDTNTYLASGHKWTFPSGAAGTYFGANHYSMGVDYANGGWTGPNYSDLIIGYHTGIRIGAAYGGTRFYADSPTTDANNDGNGDGGETLLMTVGGVPTGGNGVRIENTLTVGGVTNSNSYSVGAASANGRLINGSWGFRHQTDSGYIEFGPANTSHAHIYTDRDNFYFNKYLLVNNALVWNAGNDGSGSGLDADLLDGLQPSQLSVSSAIASDYLNSVNYATNYSSNLIYWQSSGLDTNYAPDGDWYNTIRGSHGGGNSYYSNTLAMQMTGGVAGTIFTQTRQNGSLSGWNRFWHSNNDGSGSGLDADLLDGYNSDNFLGKFGNGYYQANTWIQLTAEHGLYMPSINNAHFYPNGVTSYGTWRIIGSRNGYTGIHLDYGNVNIGMYDSGGNGGDYSSSAAGGWHYYYHRANRCLGVAGADTSSSYGLYEQGGGIYSTGNITAYSDRRVKENIRTIDNALETVEQMRGVYYNRIDDEEKKTVIGFIAQEVDEVEGAKPLVTYAADVDQYGVSYGNATALLVEAIKELSQQVKDLQKEIKELKNA